MKRVFTLQSIKSRIETYCKKAVSSILQWFLLYSPLNQGLKLKKVDYQALSQLRFLLYSPLNQGLKPGKDGCL